MTILKSFKDLILGKEKDVCNSNNCDYHRFIPTIEEIENLTNLIAKCEKFNPGETEEMRKEFRTFFQQASPYINFIIDNTDRAYALKYTHDKLGFGILDEHFLLSPFQREKVENKIRGVVNKLNENPGLNVPRYHQTREFPVKQSGNVQIVEQPKPRASKPLPDRSQSLFHKAIIIKDSDIDDTFMTIADSCNFLNKAHSVVYYWAQTDRIKTYRTERISQFLFKKEELINMRDNYTPLPRGKNGSTRKIRPYQKRHKKWSL